MRAWLKAWGFALAGAWLATGALGLVEAAVQWARFGPPAAVAGAGLWRAVLPPLTLHGWAGVGAAVLMFPTAALLARRARRPRRIAAATAVAGGAAAVIALWAAYLLRERVMPAWWAAHGAIAGKVLLALLWAIVTATGGRLLWALGARAARIPALLLLVPAALAGGLTAGWPDWRAEGTAARTSGLAPAAEPPAADAPNVLLVSIDALRRDHLSCVSDQAPPTPALDALAAEGTLCANAWSPGPWTLPGMGALMTGLTPRALDVRRYRALPDGATTLAATAWEQGWQTVAFATNPYLTPWYGFDKGFAAYEHALFLEPLLPAERAVLVRELVRYADLHFDADAADVVVPKAVKWLRRHGRQRPFFLWLHLLDPHLPYSWRDLPAGALPPGRGVAPERAAVPDDWPFAGGSFAALQAVRDGAWAPDESARRAIATLYAREVQFADAWCGRLLTELRRLGLWERTVIVVTSDHGEELFDHGGFEHGHSLLPEVTGVPLIVRLPAAEHRGLVVTEQVSLLDVLPTLCAALGWPLPDGGAGRDLSRLLREGDAAGGGGGPDGTGGRGAAGVLRLENMLYGPEQLGLLRWPWLGIASPAEAAAAWFDLAADPTAGRALPAPPLAAAAVWVLGAVAGTEADSVAKELRVGEISGMPAREVPEEVRRQMRSLGY